MRIRVMLAYAMFSVGLAAHADTFTTFNLSGSVTNSFPIQCVGILTEPVNGNFLFDDTTQELISGSVIVGVDVYESFFRLRSSQDDGFFYAGYSAPDQYISNYFSFLIISPQASLSTSTGTAVEYDYMDVPYYPSYFGASIFQGYGAITPETLTVVTPEPSSLMLLLTGVLCTTGVARRLWFSRPSSCLLGVLSRGGTLQRWSL